MSPIRRTIKKLLGDVQRGTTSPARPFFVCGHPRSGTNWVSSLLNLHPRIFCDGEFHFHLIRSGIDAFESQPWYIGSREPVKAEVERCFDDTVLRCLIAQARRPVEQGGKPQAEHVGDHTPRMLRVLIRPPEGRYIIIFRDGRDVLVSWTFHLLKTSRPDIMHRDVRPLFERVLPGADASADASRVAARRLLSDRAWVQHYAAAWSDHTGHDLATLRRLEDEGAGSSLLHLTYESLHRDVEGQRARMYAFLGADPSQAAPLSRDTHTAPGFGRESPRAFYRKGEVGDWRNYLTDDSHAWVLESAGTRLKELGYDTDTRPAAAASAASAKVHIPSAAASKEPA